MLIAFRYLQHPRTLLFGWYFNSCISRAGHHASCSLWCFLGGVLSAPVSVVETFPRRLSSALVPYTFDTKAVHLSAKRDGSESDGVAAGRRGAASGNRFVASECDVVDHRNDDHGGPAHFLQHEHGHAMAPARLYARRV